MANKMLIDATHPEETRVVVLRGNRVEEFDFESAQRKQLRGNIYLAKVTRVEPSLQAAFVDYGGNRHGFLAFSEIHPDYYQIPVADRQALIDEEGRAQRAAEDEADRRRADIAAAAGQRRRGATMKSGMAKRPRPRRAKPPRRKSMATKSRSRMKQASRPRTPRGRRFPSHRREIEHEREVAAASSSERAEPPLLRRKRIRAPRSFSSSDAA